MSPAILYLRLLRVGNDGRRLLLEALQQECRVRDERHRNGEQGVHEDVQLGLTKPVLPQPLQHVLLVTQVAPVNAWEPPAEVDDGRKLRHAPLPGVARVRHLHERDVEIVGFAVDVFQLVHYHLALFEFRFVWNASTSFSVIQFYIRLNTGCTSVKCSFLTTHGAQEQFVL